MDQDLHQALYVITEHNCRLINEISYSDAILVRRLGVYMKGNWFKLQVPVNLLLHFIFILYGNE